MRLIILSKEMELFVLLTIIKFNFYVIFYFLFCQCILKYAKKKFNRQIICVTFKIVYYFILIYYTLYNFQFILNQYTFFIIIFFLSKNNIFILISISI